MATTFNPSLVSGASERSEPGFFRRVFDRLVEAKQREANRQIAMYLQSYDAKTLERLGYTSDQVKQIFRNNHVN